MKKTTLAAALAATALSTGFAFAQSSTTPAPATPPASTMQNQSTTSGSTAPAGQFMTQLSGDMMRASKLKGVDVYGSDNQKIGDVDELLVDREGKIQAIVVGVGGFLGIGTKDVAIPFNQVQWMNRDEARTAANTTTTTTTTGGVAAPANPNAPATTGSTATTTAATSDDGTPDRAMVKMTKADLQNAPEFHYRETRATNTGTTNPPAKSPATAQ